MASSQIKYIYKIVPDAYHGTKLEIAKKIIGEDKFHHSLYSHGNHPYLGRGVYFFEGALARAVKWAWGKFKRGEIGIIKAIINLGSCLDLTDPDNIKLLKYTESKLLGEKGLKTVTTAYVINACAAIHDVDTVRSSFYKGSWPGSEFPNNELIICVRKNRAIGAMSLVYEGVIR